MRTGRPIDKKKKSSLLAAILIDDDDRHLLSGSVFFHGNGYVAIRVNGSRKQVMIHRLIMNPDPGLFVDHINGNRLDNRRKNLRIVTKSQNQMNSKKTSRNNKTSIRKGVFLIAGRDGWHAQIKICGKKKYLGRFRCETTAALAYDKAAKALFGEFARPNFGGS